MIIAHACSNEVLYCPVSAATRQLLLHCSSFCCLNIPFDGTIKLVSYYGSQQVNMPVKASMITHTMCVHAAALESITGIEQKISPLVLFKQRDPWPCCKVVVIQVLSNSSPIGRVIR